MPPFLFAGKIATYLSVGNVRVGIRPGAYYSTAIRAALAP
jgi:hypothetical protein